MSWELSFIAKGDTFRPSRVNFPFEWQHDAGEIEASGKFMGVPRPFGVAKMLPPSEQQGRSALPSLCQLAEQAKPALLAAGAEHFAVWVTREYEHQCNEELSPDELSLIASLGCSLCYSAYQMDGAASGA